MPRPKNENGLDFDDEKQIELQKAKEKYVIDKREEDKLKKQCAEVIKDYIAKEPPLLQRFKIQTNDTKYKQCSHCKAQNLIYPRDFEDYLNHYWDTKYRHKKCDERADKRCNNCFTSYIQKEKEKYNDKLDYCEYCGATYQNPYKKGSREFKSYKTLEHDSSVSHTLYEMYKDTAFCDIMDYLNIRDRASSKNIFTMKKADLINWIKETNIKYKITETKSHWIILNDIVQLFIKNNNSFPIDAEYNFWNQFSRDELCVLIRECKAKIKSYKNITKEELIKQIILL